MKTGVFWQLGNVSDAQLRSDLRTLLASGYRTEARIIAHIAEVAERKLHLKDGSSSLFDYCLTTLGLSNGEAFHRMTAATIARQYPIVFSLIERREIHLTAVCMLRDYLTPENHLELLAEASHKSKFQVQELLARRFPRPDVVSRIRKLPGNRTACAASEHPTRREADQHSPPISALPTPVLHEAATAPPVPARLAIETAVPAAVTSGSGRQASIPAPTSLRAPMAPTSHRASIEPTSASRYRIQLNASASLKEKLELFQALVSHSVPNGDIAAVLERALDLALEQAQKRRFAKTSRPHSMRTRTAKRASTHREHVPNAVQREIAVRDGLRCSYVSASGCRCSARAFLQIHHEEAWARGGAATATNLRLLCASHNRLLAERDFGASFVAEREAARRRSAECRPPNNAQSNDNEAQDREIS
ncbi:MAG TPA: hypothetical protein VGL19_09245 [Polyangiaceae bacterium]|jgi:hypothetical protein